jgi:hypothetical protein
MNAGDVVAADIAGNSRLMHAGHTGGAAMPSFT